LLWFGDSRGLGFRGFDARGEPTLFRLTVATGEWETFPLPVPFDGALIEWNADGSRYFYVRKRPGDDTAIVERDLQSDRERIVFRGNLSVDGLRFSPDRRLLAINRYTPEIKGNSRQQGIVVLEVETGQTRVVYDRTFEGASTFDSLAVTWSPDARALLVLRTERPGSDQQATDLRLIQIDGSEVRPIPLGPEVSRLLSSGRGAPRPTMRSVAWSPDGRRLGFVLTASQLESFVIENPLANVGSADGTARK
jgi:dipeptidyl aminopeptidase/acylaminoacyl peptidase